jgi:hypothetical protein
VSLDRFSLPRRFRLFIDLIAVLPLYAIYPFLPIFVSQLPPDVAANYYLRDANGTLINPEAPGEVQGVSTNFKTLSTPTGDIRGSTVFTREFRVIRIIHLVWLIKMLRVPAYLLTKDFIIRISTGLKKIIQYVFWAVYTVHLISCVWIYLGDISEVFSQVNWIRYGPARVRREIFLLGSTSAVYWFRHACPFNFLFFFFCFFFSF